MWPDLKCFSGTSFPRCPYGDVYFFSQISWHVPIFQTCEANFSKSRTDTDTMFSLKVAQDPRPHFCREKFSKKTRFHGFFQKKFWKNANFDNFSSLMSYISELRPNTMSMVSYIVQAFYRLHFGLKMTLFFSYSVFLGKKEDKNFFEKIFLIPSSYFSKLIKDTETVFFREEQHRYRLLFGPTKLPSSSMTPSFFCQKNFNFFQKNFLVLFNLSS